MDKVENLYFHKTLASLFASKPLYLDAPTQKKPNTRKLVEQPWQQSKAEMWDEVTATLCSLGFIQAKFLAKMVLRLFDDFEVVLSNKNEIWLGRNKLIEYFFLIQNQSFLFGPAIQQGKFKAQIYFFGDSNYVVPRFRVYFTSTYTDLQEERRAVIANIYPQLKRLCSDLGMRFEMVDMGFGISEETQLNNKVLSVVFHEIERCKHITPGGPYILFLLGDKYGWQPIPEIIPENEIQDFWEFMTRSDRILIEQWYRKDENAIPPNYLLLPRVEDLKDYRLWAPIETDIRTAMRTAVDKLHFTEQQRNKYLSSTIHQEIWMGVRNYDNPEVRAFGCCRNINNAIDVFPNTKDFINRTYQDGVDFEAYYRQNSFKVEMKQYLPNNIIDFNIKWPSEELSNNDMSSMCDFIFQKFADQIRKQYHDYENNSFANQSTQDDIINDLTEFFIGQQDILNELQSYLNGDDNKPIILEGISGSGKSAITAELVKIMKVQKSYAEIVVHFLGEPGNVSSSSYLLWDLYNYISKTYGLNGEPNYPSEYNELVQMLSIVFELVTINRPLIIILDGLEKLTDFNLHKFRWIPNELPEHIKIVLSVSPGEHLNFLKKRIPFARIITLDSFSVKESDILSHKWLKKANRTLTDEQNQYLLSMFSHCSLPLYVKLASEIACHWRSFDRIPNIALDIEGIIMNSVLKISKNHDDFIVSRVLNIINTAKDGIKEEEIIELLELDTEFWDYYITKLGPNNRQIVGENGEYVLQVTWSRLYYDLKPYLREDNGLISLRYRQLAEQIHDSNRKQRHLLLAVYFNNKPLVFDGSWRKINYRKLSELPYHLFHGGLWDELIDTLTNFEFIKAKCLIGMTTELLLDFERSAEIPAIDLMRRFVQKKSSIFRSFPDLVLQEALNEPLESEICQRAKQEVKKSNDILWIEWINKPQLDDPCCGTFFGHKGWINSCSLSPDSKQIVSCSTDKNLIIWSSDNGEIEQYLKGHTQSVNSCKWSFHGDQIVSASDDETLRVWDVETGKEIFIFKGHFRPVRTCDWSADDNRILSASIDGNIIIWTTQTGAEVLKINAHKLSINTCLWSPDGNRIVSASDDTTLKIWDSDSGELLKELLCHSHYVSSCAWSPDGKKIVSASWDKTVKIWDAETGNELKTLIGHLGPVKSCFWSPDGKFVVSGSSDNTLMIWDVSTYLCVAILEGHLNYINECIWTNDNKNIISASCDLTLKKWNIRLDANRFNMKNRMRHLSSVKHISISPDRKRFVSASDDKSLRIWDSITNEQLAELLGHSATVNRCLWMPNDRQIASVSDDCSIKIWDSQGERETFTLLGHKKRITSCEISPDGYYLATTSYDQTLKIWSLQKNIEIFSKVTLSALETCTWSPDGKLIFYSGWDGTVRALTISNKKEENFYYHTSIIKVCTFSPDGNFLLIGSQDGSLIILDTKNRANIIVLPGHNAEVTSCVWSADGKRIISGAKDNQLIIWDIDKKDKIALFIPKGDISAITKPQVNTKLIIGDSTGNIYELQMNGITFSEPIITSIAFNNGNFNSLNCFCEWCQNSFIAGPIIFESIKAINRKYMIGQDDTPCFKLPIEAWEEPNLLCECPNCGGKLKINPFFI